MVLLSKVLLFRLLLTHLPLFLLLCKFEFLSSFDRQLALNYLQVSQFKKFSSCLMFVKVVILSD